MVKKITQVLESRLSQIADVDRARSMSAYMKDRFQYLGVASPERKLILKEWIKEHKQLIDIDFRVIAKHLYQSQYRELHYCGIELMVQYKKALTVGDITLIQYLIVTHSWWDTVDLIASHLVGICFHDHQVRDEMTSKWMKSGNLWLQRSCIISQLKYKEATDLDYLFTLVNQTYLSDEFFIQKANGWALRQASKYFRTDIAAFVATKEDWPRVTYKEAVKYLD